MAIQENDKWIDDRIAGLTSGHAHMPNAARAFAKLQARTRQRAPAARRWIWTTAVALCAYFMFLVLPASHACAEQPGPCVVHVLGVAPHIEPAVLEIYIDRQSPEYATFMREVEPQLAEFYVRPGKLRLVVKDSPLPYAVIVRNGARQTITETPLNFAALQAKLD